MRSGHRFPEPLAELRRMPCASATVLHPGSNLRSRRDAPSRRTGLSSSTLTSARAVPVFLRRGGGMVFTGFAAGMEAAHGIQPGWTAWLTVDTIVCRCEEVTYGRFCSTLA